jgi:chaperonin GroES
MALKPLNDRIVVEPAEAETVTSSGLILPDSAQEKPQRGVVVAVGPGKLLDNGKTTKMDIKVGETVLYGKYAGTEVRVGSEEYVILRQDDVLAVVDGAKAAKSGTGKALAAAGKGKK